MSATLKMTFYKNVLMPLDTPEREAGLGGSIKKLFRILGGKKEFAVIGSEAVSMGFTKKRIGEEILDLAQLRINGRPDMRYETTGRRMITVGGRTTLTDESENLVAAKLPGQLGHLVRILVTRPQDPHNAGELRALKVFEMDQGGFVMVTRDRIFSGERKWETRTHTRYFNAGGHEVQDEWGKSPKALKVFRKSLGL